MSFTARQKKRLEEEGVSVAVSPDSPRRSAHPTGPAPPNAGGCPGGEMHGKVKPSGPRGWKGSGRGWAPSVAEKERTALPPRRGGRHSNGRTASAIGAVGRRRGGHGDSHTSGAGTAEEREGCETALTGDRRGEGKRF